jgi:vacuolar-type H+-ATPase subunit I/STV1
MTEFPEIERLREASGPLTVCKRSGASPYDCPDEFACENGCSTHDVYLVNLPDAEQAVRDAVERVGKETARYKYLWELEAGRATKAESESFGRLYDRIVVERDARHQAVRECVEALREDAAARPSGKLDHGWGAAADFLARTMLGGEDD